MLNSIEAVEIAHDRAALGELLRSVLAQLKPNHRHILIMRALGWSREEIASQMGIARQSVDVAEARAIRDARICMQHRGFMNCADVLSNLSHWN